MSNIILAIGALFIFGTFLSSSNRLMTGNTQIAEQNEYYISAISLAQSIIDEAKTKSFDQNTINVPVLVPDSLTAPGLLGREAGEVIGNPDTLVTTAPYTPSSPGYRSTYTLNDIDDYRNYNRLVNTQRAEGYRVKVSVNYANETNPDVSSAVKTFCKKMTVQVISPYMPDTIKLSYAFTY
ncbi:MAG: hypothetical protein HYR76_02480 [Ignavibacteria bacterium]|nr:hypothetical protein [Ignavibacteria bacterium]MBI3765275.1 hypothetical protein [Ignavibacteriales bacterium]